MILINALDCIPKRIEQFKTENAKLEKDLPTLTEVAGGTWKKEDELKQFKSEVAALDRKIQLTLTPAQPQNEQEKSKEKHHDKIKSQIQIPELLVKNTVVLNSSTTDTSFEKTNVSPFQEHNHLIRSKSSDNKANLSKGFKL